MSEETPGWYRDFHCRDCGTDMRTTAIAQPGDPCPVCGNMNLVPIQRPAPQVADPLPVNAQELHLMADGLAILGCPQCQHSCHFGAVHTNEDGRLSFDCEKCGRRIVTEYHFRPNSDSQVDRLKHL